MSSVLCLLGVVCICVKLFILVICAFFLGILICVLLWVFDALGRIYGIINSTGNGS